MVDYRIQPATGVYEYQGMPAELQVGQRGALIGTTRMLEEQSRQTDKTRSWYAIATTVCAHAAADAILSEWLLQRDR